MPDRYNTFEKISLLAIIITIVLLLILAGTLDKYHGGSLTANKSLITFIPYAAIAGFLGSKFSGLLRLGQAKACILKRSQKQEIIIVQISFVFVLQTAILAILLTNYVPLSIILHVLLVSMLIYYLYFVNLWWTIRENGIMVNLFRISWSAVESIHWSSDDAMLLVFDTRRKKRSIKVRVPSEERKKVIDNLRDRYPEIASG